MTDARDVIARAIGADQDDTDWSEATADTVVAALAAAGLSITATPDCGHPNHGSADHDCKPFTATPDHAVPRAAVVDLAQRWEDVRELSMGCDQAAAELRALAGGDQ